MKADNFDISSKWLILGFPEYCFGSDKELYKLPFNSGKNYYGLRKIKKQPYNRWLLKGKFWSEKQLLPKLYLNPNPKILIKNENNPF